MLKSQSSVLALASLSLSLLLLLLELLAGGGGVCNGCFGGGSAAVGALLSGGGAVAVELSLSLLLPLRLLLLEADFGPALVPAEKTNALCFISLGGSLRTNSVEDLTTILWNSGSVLCFNSLDRSCVKFLLDVGLNLFVLNWSQKAIRAWRATSVAVSGDTCATHTDLNMQR